MEKKPYFSTHLNWNRKKNDREKSDCLYLLTFDGFPKHRHK